MVLSKGETSSRKPPAILEANKLHPEKGHHGHHCEKPAFLSCFEEEEVPFSLADEGNLTLVVLLGHLVLLLSYMPSSSLSQLAKSAGSTLLPVLHRCYHG